MLVMMHKHCHTDEEFSTGFVNVGKKVVTFPLFVSLSGHMEQHDCVLTA